MGSEINLDPDLGAVEPERLSTYALTAAAGRIGEPPAESFVFEGVRALTPVTNREREIVYSVEIEYRPDRGDRVLHKDSLKDYLATYADAKTTQELMAQTIRSHLIRTLDVDDLFVEVNRSDIGVKTVRLGKPA